MYHGKIANYPNSIIHNMHKMKKNRHDRSIPVIIKQILNKKIDTFYTTIMTIKDKEKILQKNCHQLFTSCFFCKKIRQVISLYSRWQSNIQRKKNNGKDKNNIKHV